MRKAVKIGFIGVFCAVIGLAFPVFNIFSKQLSMDSHENRLMTGDELYGIGSVSKIYTA